MPLPGDIAGEMPECNMQVNCIAMNYVFTNCFPFHCSNLFFIIPWLWNCCENGDNVLSVAYLSKGNFKFNYMCF